MANHIRDDYLDDLTFQLKHLPDKERRAVLAEVKAHLAQETAALRKSNPALSEDEAWLQATHAFGEPRDIGVSYGSNGSAGGVVRKSTGELVLQVAVLTGRGVARTVGTTVKWILIILGIVLATVLGIAVVLLIVAGGVLIAYEDEISASVPRPIYGYQAAWPLTDPQASTRTDSFQVSTDATGMDLLLEIAPQTGCLAVQVYAPDNAVAYSNGQGCDDTSQQLHFAQQGSWRIVYTFAAFTGSVDISGYEYRPG